MERLEKIVSNLVFFLLCLLTFLLLFESHVTIPFWLQTVGRMHPMVLHFPIALIVMLVLLHLFHSQLEPASYEKVRKALLYLTAVTTSLSAIMGFFLSREEGYTSDLMTLHKWVGVSVCYLVYLLLLADPVKWFYKITLYSSLVILFLAGHFGAGLTHGTDFLLEPITKAREKEITEDTPVFAAFVDPILEAKCKGCHNNEKHKGGLDMTTFSLISKGGESGPLWIQGQPEQSEIIIRALLPPDHEHHMPPEGKPQLTGAELALLRSWIAAGADPSVSMADLKPSDTLFMLTSQRMNVQQGGQSGRYNFDFASSELVASLNNPYRTVTRQSPGSPALDVNIFVRQAFKPEFLTELNKIKEQVVSLNLAYMPIGDQELTTITGFNNLERLNLNHTNITSGALAYLKSCSRLHSLSLSGTAVDMGLSEMLGELPALKDIFLWNTAIGNDDVEALKKQWPGISFHLGYEANHEEPIQLTPPILENKQKILDKGEKIILEHKLPGVSIRYTTDGSEPDSVASNLYREPVDVPVSGDGIKTLAYKEGWLSSEVKRFEFFIKGEQPVTAELINDPGKKYQGTGALTLIDLEKGEATNFAGKAWLGYQDAPFAAWVDFGENPPTLQQLVLSYGINMRQYIMPPTKVEIWGGNDKQDMGLLKTVAPFQPIDYQPNAVSGISLFFKPSNFRFYKVKALPVRRLPVWHSGKGRPGWVFVDELFFYK